MSPFHRSRPSVPLCGSRLERPSAAEFFDHKSPADFLTIRLATLMFRKIAHTKQPVNSIEFYNIARNAWFTLIHVQAENEA